MAIQNFFTSRDNTLDGNTYVGQFGRLWYNPDTNSIYASDGRTVGGIPISLAQGANISSNVFSVNTLIPLSSNFITVDTDLRVTGNVTANNFLGNLNLSGNVVLGNVFSDDYYYANGEPFVSSNYGDPNVVALLADLGSNNIATTGTITANNLTITGNALFTGNLRATGNVTLINSDDLEVGNLHLILAADAQQPSDANSAGILLGNESAVIFGSMEWYFLTNTWIISDNVRSNVATFTTAVVSGNLSANNIAASQHVTATGNITTAGNLAAGNISVARSISANSNITATGNVTAGNLTTTGDVRANNVVLTGNITNSGTLFSGSIIPASNGIYSLGNSTRWWSNLWVSSNTIYIGGVPLGTSGTDLTVNGQPLVVNDANTDINTTGSITANNISVQDTLAAISIQGDTADITGNVTVGNLATTGALIITGNVGGGNLVTSGQVTATGNVSGGNITTTGLISATGNLAAGNISTTGQVTATGNITGGNITTAGRVTATGNVTGGNIITTGLITATGNLAAGNINTGVLVATGNATANNLISTQSIYAINDLILGNTANAQVTKARITISGNTTFIQTGNGTTASTGNVAFAPWESDTQRAVIDTATGNITAGNLITAGLLRANGNITGGNLITAGNVTATGNVFVGNLISNSEIFSTGALVLGNIANNSAPKLRSVNFGNNSYIQTGNGTIGSTGNIIFSPYSDATERVVINTATGNLTVGNITSSTSNLTLTTSGGLRYSFSGDGLTLPTIGGEEGGEIRFGVPATNTSLVDRVTVDVWQDRFRIFQGSSARGVYIDLTQAAPTVGTLLNNRVSGRVDAGAFVTMDNLRATVTLSGGRGLGLATVAGSISYNIGGTYGSGVGSGGASLAGQTLTTTVTNAMFGWNFNIAGDVSFYVLDDLTNRRSYRITIQIGPGWLDNTVCIERIT